MDEDTTTFAQRICGVLKNYVFVLLCIAITGLYFIVAGIQYWVSHYMLAELKIEESLVFTTFGIVSITGPVFGVIVGGNVTTKMGGCET